jgi:hypothetical protein
MRLLLAYLHWIMRSYALVCRPSENALCELAQVMSSYANEY